MPTTVLPIVNPGGETPIVAPWVATVGVPAQGSGPHSGAFSISTPNTANYDFRQDIAIPNADWPSIDAGTRTVVYSAWGRIFLNPTPSLTLWLHALDALGAILQTWSYNVTTGSWENWNLYAALPPLTRSMRVRMSGFDWTNRAHVDDLSLALEDVGERVTKAQAYVVAGVPRQDLSAVKGNEYLVFGPGVAGTLAVSKAILYGVFGPDQLLRVTKALAYLVVGKPDQCGYEGTIMACADRPGAGVFSECAVRPDSGAEACGGPRPAVTFQSGDAIVRCP